MRIAAISTLVGGGATIAAARITQALSRAGHECSFFALDKSGTSFFTPFSDTGQKADGDSFWIDAAIARWSKLCRPEAFDGGAELFSDTLVGLPPLSPLPNAIQNAEVIHLHWVAGILFSPALIDVLQNKKVVWTLHDMNAFTGGCHYHPTCRKFETHCENCPMLRIFSKDDASARGFALKEALYQFMAPTFVCPSRWLADEAASSTLLRSHPIHVAPNCCDLDVFAPKPQAPLRERLGLRRDSLVLLAGAEYLTTKRKNTQAFWDALQLIGANEENLDIEILTFGQGDPPPVPFPVHPLGKLDDDTALADAYAAADLYVHTALMDNLPNTLCEAQCCGTPVLSFAAGGCPETMLPGETGFLLKEKTAEALAFELKRIYCNRQALAPMREAARAFAVERFSPQAAAAAYVNIFEAAVPATSFAPEAQIFKALQQNQFASLAEAVRYSLDALALPLADNKEHLLQLSNRLTHIEEFSSRLANAEEEISELSSCLVRVEECLSLFSNRLQEAEQCNERLSAQNEHLSAQNEHLSDQNEVLDKRLAEQATQLKNLQNKIASIRYSLRHPVSYILRKLREKLKK